MLQIIQSLKTGKTSLEEVPSPRVQPGCVLIQTTRSLVSLGTERMLVEFGKANLVQKAQQQPEKVRMVLDKIKAEGLLPTLEAVFNKLEQPLPLGYCNVGRVIAIGEGVSGFAVGDRVASNGPHASVVCVPQNLVALIPDDVSDSEAAFTVIGAIGLQGIRLLDPQLGERVVVIGLGLIGQITAQLLMANGCDVLGIDLDPSKLKIAASKGISVLDPTREDVVAGVLRWTNEIGADGVIITASSKSNDIVHQAAAMSRKRGKIVLVGVVGLQLNRNDFYQKELTFQVSCSYGPGRYDPHYEEKGLDYPLPFVRWTEKRNFEALLQAIAKGRLDVQSLITEELDLDDYLQIYGDMRGSRSIASLLKYPERVSRRFSIALDDRSFRGEQGVMAIIGAGNFTKMTMLPNLKGAQLKYIVGAGGVNSMALAKKYEIQRAGTDMEEVLQDSEVDLLLITTRHHLHAEMVIKGLKAGKHVFVEKPLCISSQELDDIVDTYREASGLTLNVGFNRRFSLHMQKIKSLVPASAHKNMVMTMNAGHIPQEVWVQDMQVGGGRIIGEACHIIDLMVMLSGSKVRQVCMSSLGVSPSVNTDNASILLRFENGDHGTVHYFSNGHKSYSKERLEVFFEGKTLIMDNYRKTSGYGVSGFSSFKTRIDKGHSTQFRMLKERLENGGAALIPFDEIVNVTKTTFVALESLKNNTWVDVE